MSEVIFNFKGIETKVQCNIYDTMKIIKNKFIIKTQIDENKIYFLYNGGKINEELTFLQQANELDRKAKIMNILVFEKEEKTNIKQHRIKSKEIICPYCGENILITFKDNKIYLYECKNGHSITNILYEEYENTQKIDLSKIKCDKCKEKTKGNTYNNEFYICNTCNMKLCPLCKNIHDNNHNIINYDDKNYICKNHNDIFIKYCKECKENMCLFCEKDHKNHNLFNFSNTIINKNELLKECNNLRNIIDKLKNSSEQIKYILNKVLNKMEIYYNINKDIITNYDNKKRNYYIINNLNKIRDTNKFIINYINNIIKETDINKKFNNLMIIYDNKNIENKTEKYENGNLYIGGFKNNLRNGKGIMYYNSDFSKIERYEGQWKDGRMEGKGKMYWVSGDIYEGDFKNDKMEGKGIMYYNKNDTAQREKYDGEWRDGQMEGKGIMYYNKNDTAQIEKYDGEWKEGQIEGKGILYWSFGDRYEGEFKNNKIEGKGIIYYVDGDRYEGDLKNGKKDGKGIYYKKIGDRYEGNFKNDKADGKGIYYYKDGRKYEGDWKDNKKHGNGIFYHNNGDREMGEYYYEQNIGIHAILTLDGNVSRKEY